MSFFSDLIAPTTVAQVRALIIGYAQSAGLTITDWIVGAVGQQIFEAVNQTVYATTSVYAQVARGYASLDTSTDPGDYDPYNADNINYTPSAGMLSYYGQNTYSTTRREATFASGYVTFSNAGIVARTFGPGSLVFTWTGGSPPSPAPTYVNAPDASIYTNPDGTITVNAGASVSLPITATVAGSASSAPPSTITLTTSLVGCTATNAAAVTGQDRESADAYRARCRQAPSRLSLGAPPGAYEYLAATQLDGDPLLNASGNPVNISRVSLSGSSVTGIVQAYFASPSGAASGEDVTAANANIEENAFAVPDCITYSGTAASEVAISVAGTAKIASGPGVVSATVRQAIVDALTAYFETLPIGGLDQTGGTGVVYTSDLQSVAQGAYAGLYAVSVTTPATATTALTTSQVATYTGTISDWTLTIV